MTTKTAAATTRSKPRATKPKPATAQEFRRIALDIVGELNLAALVKKVDFSPRLFVVFGHQDQALVSTLEGIPSPVTDPLYLRLTLLSFGRAQAAAGSLAILGIFLLYEEAGEPILIGKTSTGLSLVAKPSSRPPHDLTVGDCTQGDPPDDRHPLDAFLIAADTKRQGEAVKMIGDCIVELRPFDETLEGLTTARKGFHTFRTYDRRGQL